MQLRARLGFQPETFSDFTFAAEQKYREGIDLAVSGHRGAGIYLMGYAAEMVLKIASFRFDGARAADPVEPRLAPATVGLASRPTAVPHEGYHSLLFWLAYLRARRATVRRALPRGLNGELGHRVRRLYAIWWVEMRYRPDQATPFDAERVFRDVTWLRDHFDVLWR